MPGHSSTGAALLRAVCHSPADDAPRLVYADWLDEHGRPERAEFIRVQCELARLPACLTPSVGTGGKPCRECRPRNKRDCLPWCAVCEPYDDLDRRERELWAKADAVEWFNPYAAGLATIRLKPGTVWYPRPIGYVIRGFVQVVECEAAAFASGSPESCRVCNGVGKRTVRKNDWPQPMKTKTVVCPGCKGTGRLPALAANLFTAHPITEARLTTAPGQDDDLPLVHNADRRHFTCGRWPGVAFHLPDGAIHFVNGVAVGVATERGCLLRRESPRDALRRARRDGDMPFIGPVPSG
jgi:uncharacterized protein (TIGR02996 family)